MPTIIEVLPYRKRDIYAPRDAMHHGYFAGHGYAAMRVDIRGSGDSDGYQGVFAMQQEQDDTLEVLKWIAQQPWSDGQVGMFGISCGGFQAIQTAYRAPPELKAIIPCSFAPDRYRYSQVFRGGSILLRSIRWSSQLFGYKSRAPDPALVGPRWREMWMQRLENDLPQIMSALKHQNDGEFWRSRAIHFDKIKCPMYAVSGCADGSYVGAVGVALKELKVPRKALVGPWGHRFAYLGVPGPAIGFLQESVRWITEPVWPSPRIKTKRYALNAGGILGERAGTVTAVEWQSPQTLGLDGGELMPWFQHGPSPEMPGDQRADDGKSLCFNTPPLKKTVEILGIPAVNVTFSVDRPTAFICVRLCDVAPNGASTRVTYGIFNLTHVNGADKPLKLIPGKRYALRVPLIDTAYAFVKGHRMRVAVSTTYWPLIWPSPQPVTLLKSMDEPGVKKRIASDIMGRLIAQQMAEGLGQQVVVENRAGAAQNIAAEFVAKAPADGYTVFLISAALGINVSLYPKLNYDPVKDFVPVAVFATSPNLLMVHPSFPAKNAREFIAVAKKNPGKLNFSSSGSGSSQHLSGEMLKIQIGVDMTHIPYKGSAPSMTALASGEVDFSFNNIPSAQPLMTPGRVRALAITSEKRSQLLPELPTMIEGGLAGFVTQTWYGVLVPAGTPSTPLPAPCVVCSAQQSTRQLKHIGIQGLTYLYICINIQFRQSDKWSKYIDIK